MRYPPSTETTACLIALSVFVALTVLTAVLRFLSRNLKKLSYGLDDYLMLGALAGLITSTVIIYVSIFAGGVGVKIQNVRPEDVVLSLKILLPFESLYGITLCLSKCSVCVFYLKLFGNLRVFRLSAYAAMAVLVMWATSIFFETLFLCRPLAFNWNPTIPGGVCGDRDKVFVSAGALNIITDFMVMGLPIPHILKLHLPLKKKLGLILMFSLGSFVIAVSILRIESLLALSFTDPTLTLLMPMFWTIIEPAICIINSNLPMVMVFLTVTFGKSEGLLSSGVTGGGRSGDSKFHNKNARPRPNEFEMLGDVNDGIMKTTVKGGDSEVGSVESEERLTRGTGGIMLTQSINIERAEARHER